MFELHYYNPDLFKIIVSLALGAAIGLEREVSNKVAGLRTHILICLGATLFTILSYTFSNDPARISAQIVTGIGFLGAGSIMRDGDRVTGLTTAATIWIVAAIGMAVGYGHYTLASLVAVMVLFVQLTFTKLDILIENFRMRLTFRIISKVEDKGIAEIEKLFRESRIHIISRKLMKKDQHYYSEWYTTGGREGQEHMMRKLLESKDVIEVTY